MKSKIESCKPPFDLFIIEAMHDVLSAFKDNFSVLIDPQGTWIVR